MLETPLLSFIARKVMGGEEVEAKKYGTMRGGLFESDPRFSLCYKKPDRVVTFGVKDACVNCCIFDFGAFLALLVYKALRA